MTADGTATLQNLLLRNLAWPVRHAAPRPLPEARWRLESDAPQTQPMLFRSEGFADDLFDTHPSH